MRFSIALLAAVLVAGCVSNGPRILGHRGTRGEYQENCAEAMTLALKRGITGFETDIRMTKDGHLVIMHDADVARVSDGKGIVEELTLAEGHFGLEGMHQRARRIGANLRFERRGSGMVLILEKRP